MTARLRALVREAWVSASSQPVFFAMTVLIVASMCATILLTTGRTAAAENAVLGSIDSVGTRSIIVRAEPAAGLDSRVMGRVAALHGIEWIGAFGPPVDTTATEIPGGPKVPVRNAWIPNHETGDDDREVWASPQALHELGFTSAAGGLSSVDGVDFSIRGALHVPSSLAFMEPLVVRPLPPDVDAPVSVLIIVAKKPQTVAGLSSAVYSVLGADDPTKVKIETSSKLAELRAIVAGQLGEYGRGLVLLVFAISTVLVASVLFALVTLRRKDFGRRRALGASQHLIIALLLTQVTLLALIGAAIGTLGSIGWLIVSGSALPGVSFIAGTAILAISAATLAAVLPALFASRRDPLRELRVP